MKVLYLYRCKGPEQHQFAYARSDLAGSECTVCLHRLVRNYKEEAVGVNIANLKDARA